MDAHTAIGEAVVAAARRAIELFVREGRRAIPDTLPDELPARAGVFVTIREHADGALRGCVGTVEPVEPTLGLEIVRSAILAATEDPRFQAVEPAELANLDYGVSVLEAPEPITGPEQLDPAVFGVIVRSGRRHALLLPGIEGIFTTADQLAAVRRKAGIGADAPIALERFRTRHFE